MKAKVDVETCIGCGLCENICPQVFRLENDKSVVQVTVVPADAEEACKEAEDSCPVGAITLE